MGRFEVDKGLAPMVFIHQRYITIQKGCWHTPRQKRRRIQLQRPIESLEACTDLCDANPNCSTIAWIRRFKTCWLQRGCDHTRGLPVAGPCSMGPNAEDHVPCTATVENVTVPPELVSTLSFDNAARLASRLLPSSYGSVSDSCSSPLRDMVRGQYLIVKNLADCQARCNLVSRCRAVAYSNVTRQCALKRGCEQASMYGPCPWTEDGSCVYARDLSVRLQSQRDRKIRAQNISKFLRQVAQKNARNDLAQLLGNQGGARRPPCACGNTTVGALEGSTRVVVNRTIGTPWRYFSIFDCGDVASPVTCLTFKMGIVGASIGALRAPGVGSTDFGGMRAFVEYPPAEQKLFSHNMAIFRLSHSHYVMVGGMQGFLRTKKLGRKARWAEEDPGNYSRANGIRLAHGHGWPWWNVTWSAHKVIIHGTSPAGCIDRRPKQTGYPTLLACEFDGRLSLTRLSGSFQLYARANLAYGLLVGGRWVQVTQSSQLEHGWSPWTPVNIVGVDPAWVDLYFFAAHGNPVDPSSLLALFPISEPPFSCIAMAFSRDGVNFSKPVKLLSGKLAYRLSADKGSALTARSGDHPVAGSVLSAGTGPFSKVYFYVHHSPHGVGLSEAEQANSSVVRYEMLQSELRRLTWKGMAELEHVVPIPIPNGTDTRIFHKAKRRRRRGARNAMWRQNGSLPLWRVNESVGDTYGRIVHNRP